MRAQKGQLPVYPTRKEIVLQKIKEDLLSEKIAPKQVLNISELADIYGVSITPIREALAYLESLGIVKKVNYKSIQVAEFSEDELEEIYYMRSALSGLAAKNAAKNISSEELAHLAALLERQKETAKDPEREKEFMVNNREFHCVLAKFINTPILFTLEEQFHLIARRNQIFGFMERTYYELYLEHQSIYDAIQKGDAEET